MTTLAMRSLDAAVDAVTARASGGLLRIHEGPPPVTADSPARGTLLVECRLPSPAFAPSRGGRASAHPIAPAIAAAGGTAGWYRIVGPDGRTVWDGTAGPGGDLALTDPIVAGAEVTVEALEYAQDPA